MLISGAKKSFAGEYKAKYNCCVDEGRKRVILIAASILAARKLAQYEKPCPAIESCIVDSIVMAKKILERIDDLFPTPKI